MTETRLDDSVIDVRDEAGVLIGHLANSPAAVTALQGLTPGMTALPIVEDGDVDHVALRRAVIADPEQARAMEACPDWMAPIDLGPDWRQIEP